VGLLDIPKRIFVGRPLRSDAVGHTLLPKKLALPVFSSDAMSSVSYATEEVLLALAAGGLAYYSSTPWLALGVVALFMVITASYRQTVREYPQGGGDYTVAHENVSKTAGLVAASALLIDYVLTVSVSIAAGVYALTSAFPDSPIATHRVAFALGFIVFITLMNLRGVKEAGTFFAIPTYGFVLGIMTMLIVGLVKVATGGDLVAESASLPIEEHHLGGLASAFLLARAFSSGCTALTGVEAIANGVPAFKKPQAENAAKTLLMLAGIAITMFIGITTLAMAADVRVPGHGHGSGRSVVAQIAAAVFGDRTPGFYYVQFFTAAILVLAANTAFQDFPRLASLLAQDRYLPRQLHNRGDRLVFSNGVVALAAFASLLIIAFDANVSRLIQLYIVGVFVSFTLGQGGMVLRWSRKLRDPSYSPDDRRRMQRSRVINAVGSVTTGVVLVIVLLSKFTHGAWIVVLAMPILFAIMKAISKHYARVSEELRLASTRPVLFARNHAVVLVSQLHNPTLRALNYAKSIKAHTLTALYVEVDEAESQRLQEEWDRTGVDVPLKVIASPFREITKPVLDYVRRLRKDAGDRDVVTVVIPEYVVGKWWEQLLHNQSALRIKAFLLFQPGVMVTSVPWHLSSAPEPEQVTGDPPHGVPRGPQEAGPGDAAPDPGPA
jgi:amino acid transporter